MTDKREFTCAHCHQTFDCGWSEDEAVVEAMEVWGMTREQVLASPQVCDDCYQAMTTELPPAEWRTAQAVMERLDAALNYYLSRLTPEQRAAHDALMAAHERYVLYGDGAAPEPQGVLLGVSPVAHAARLLSDSRGSEDVR
ncbi:MAG TPA: hypothetical protein VNP72_09630 [Longimicrobium sp.]|nr:hypothetical protein [Longimicrobium sp.]